MLSRSNYVKSHKTDQTGSLLNLSRVLFLLFIAGFAVWYFATGHEFSVEAILNYTPDNYFFATLFMLLLYAVKSFVCFLPLMALQIAAGLYFPTWAAILVNIAGMVIELNIPYFIGKKLGFNSADKLFKKFPKLRGVVDGDQNKWYISYILRAVNLLPMDFVSMYLGSVRFPYFVYLSGSLVGALFGILAATFIGMSLTDPTSPMFIISCAASCLIAAASFVIYRVIIKRTEKKS